jgi:nitrate reductase gamma subunit
MSALTVVFVILGYIAIAVFIVGVLYKVWKYATTPAPLKIPQNPSPVTPAGVPPRIIMEVGLFKSLFKSNKLIWLGGYVFHLGLLLVFIKHLRFLFASTPYLINYITTFEMYAGAIMLVGLAYLFMMRIVVDRTKYISVMSDFILLVLLIAIALTGFISKHFIRVDVADAKQFMMGLITFNPQSMSADPMFIIHFSLVLLLLVYFPFSKLIHAVGLFFSPTRNQVDNPRDLKVPHRAPWAEGVLESSEVFSTDDGEAAQAPAN